MDIERIKELEAELEIVLLAMKPIEFADLTSTQLKELQKVEKNIGATVIAYRKTP
jgi:hypothetical protein